MSWLRSSCSKGARVRRSRSCAASRIRNRASFTWQLAEALIDAGELDEARPLVERLSEHGRADMDLAMGVAAMHAKLGDSDRAFGFLEGSVRLGNDQLDCYLRAGTSGSCSGTRGGGRSSRACASGSTPTSASSPGPR